MMAIGYIIYVIVVTYIVAKVVGIIVGFIRTVMKYAQPTQTPPPRNKPGRQPMPYTNVEDVDYEDITDKK